MTPQSLRSGVFGVSKMPMVEPIFSNFEVLKPVFFVKAVYIIDILIALFRNIFVVSNTDILISN